MPRKTRISRTFSEANDGKAWPLSANHSLRQAADVASPRRTTFFVDRFGKRLPFTTSMDLSCMKSGPMVLTCRWCGQSRRWHRLLQFIIAWFSHIQVESWLREKWMRPSSQSSTNWNTVGRMETATRFHGITQLFCGVQDDFFWTPGSRHNAWGTHDSRICSGHDGSQGGTSHHSDKEVLEPSSNQGHQQFMLGNRHHP